MFSEFKKFALRANALDLAFGVIMGAAFGKIVSSLVSDILMPPIGMLLGKVDLTNRFLALNGGAYSTLAEAKVAGAPTLNYGVFLNNVIDFIFVGVAILLMIRGLNKIQKPTPAPLARTRACPYCLFEIPLAATKCAHCASQVST
jgi:large conductance mechanosensitive channel